MIKLPTVKELFEAGAHFGHLREKSHPKAQSYVFTVKNKVLVINLDSTLQSLKKALDYLTLSASQGKIILLLGTKRQAKNAVERVGSATDTPYIANQWLGGTLTNFKTIKGNLKRLGELDEEIASEEFAKKSKRVQSLITKKAQGLHKNFDGLKGLDKIPDVLALIDAAKEKTAVIEARKLNIPIVGLIDTNADPSVIDYPVVANDDSTKTVELVVMLFGQAITEGKQKAKVSPQSGETKNDS